MQRAPMFETGVLLFEHPWINKPDDKYNPDGTFKVTGVGDKANPEVLNLMNLIEEKCKERFAAQITDNKALSAAEKKKWSVYIPFSDELDPDSGEPTGRVKFTFKRNHIITIQGGEKRELHISVYDTAGVQADQSDLPAIYGGTQGKILFGFRDVKVPGTHVAGVKLDFAAVKIIKLGTGRGGGDPFSKSTEDMTGGYVHQQRQHGGVAPGAANEAGEQSVEY